MNYYYFYNLYKKCISHYNLDTFEKIKNFFTNEPYNYRFDETANYYSVTYKTESGEYDETIKNPSGMAIQLTNLFRGTVFEKGSNNLLCLPMTFFNHHDEIKNIPFENLEFTDAVDGILVNLFYYNDMWRISTRGRVNAFTSFWRSHLSFGEMAANVFKGFDFSILNKNYCYSFVVEHVENTNVIIHEKNTLYHVFTRDMTTLKEVDHFIGIRRPRKHVFIYKKFLDVYLKNSNLSKNIGVIARDRKTGMRCIYYTEAYLKMKRLVKNYRDVKDIFIDNYTGVGDGIKNVRHIVSHYKKWNGVWKWVLHIYTSLIDEIEYYYDYCYKLRNKTVLPYYLKPILYEIHGIYISKKREWYRLEEIRRITERNYKRDGRRFPSPKVFRHDIIEWFANLPFERRRDILEHHFKMNSSIV